MPFPRFFRFLVLAAVVLAHLTYLPFDFLAEFRRVEYLGANTPMKDTAQVTSQTRPSLVVLTAAQPGRFASVAAELAVLAGLAPLALAGAGATTELAESVGARLLTGDPVTAAKRVASS